MARANTQRDGTAAAADPQSIEFGAALRQTRLSHGRELGDVARQLRIRQPYLQAIEDGRFEDLPGPTYAIGFVRAYADYLGLEEGEVVKRYKELRGGASAPANLVPPAPVTEGRLPTGSILLLAAILAAAAYGGWYYLSMKGRDPGEVVAALPDRIAAMVGMKREAVPSPTPGSVPAPAIAEPATEPATESTAPPATGPAASPPAAPEPVAPGAAVAPPAAEPPPAAAAPSPNAGAQPAPPTPPAPVPNVPPVAPPSAPAPAAGDTPAPTPPAAAVAPTPPAIGTFAPPPPAPDAAAGQTAARSEGESSSRVVLRAESSSWVEIRNAEDRRVFSRLMRAGETYAVPSTPGLSLTTGNAGGLTLVVDGRSLPPLGRPGDVRRDLALDADSLLRTSGLTP